MIITVTLNTAIDHILYIPEFKLGATIRSSKSFIAMGGKGTDAAYILGTLGIPNLAMGFSAGIFGAKMESMLHERNVDTDFIQVAGETRINTLLIRGEDDQSTFTVDTLEITEDHIDQLSARLSAQLPKAGCVVLGGSPPRGYPLDRYQELIHLIKAHDIPVIIDASGEALKIASQSRPAFIKVNKSEMEQLAEKTLTTFDDMILGASHVQESTGSSVILTLGDQGAIAALQDYMVRIQPLQVPVQNTAGAGDAVLAGIAHALDSKSDMTEGLRLGFAAAAAVMMTPRTADCDPQVVDRLRNKIEIGPMIF